MSVKFGDEQVAAWNERFGNNAARLIVEFYSRGRRGRYSVIVFVAVAIIGQAVKNSWIVLASVLFLIGGASLMVLSLKSLRKARIEAGKHLALPRDSWKFIPILDVERFDKWYEAKDQSFWPKRWKAKGT